MPSAISHQRSAMTRAALLAAVVAFAVSATIAASGAQREDWHGVLDQHPSIQYRTHDVSDRIAGLQQALADGSRTLARDGRTGYLRGLLDALDLPVESQLLLFSKTGVQRAFTSPHNPRALYFNKSVVVGYIPGAPLIEIASHDPQQGIVFYTLDQSASAP